MSWDFRVFLFLLFVFTTAFVKLEESQKIQAHLVPGKKIDLKFSLPLMQPDDRGRIRVTQGGNSRNRLLVTAFGANFETSETDFLIGNLFFSGLQVTIESFDRETDVEIELTTRSFKICKSLQVLQLAFSLFFFFLWRQAGPDPVAGVALTSAFATLSLATNGDASLVSTAVCGLNVASTLLTWRRLSLPGDKPGIFLNIAISVVTAALILTRLASLQVPAVAILFGLGVFFGNCWRRANDRSLHAATGAAWCLGSILENFFSHSLAANLWSEALCVLYICSVRAAARKLLGEYDEAELVDLEQRSPRKSVSAVQVE